MSDSGIEDIRRTAALWTREDGTARIRNTVVTVTESPVSPVVRSRLLVELAVDKPDL